MVDTGLLLQMKSFKFLLVLVIFDGLLSITKRLSDAFKSTKMDLAKATDLVLATVETLEDFRSDGRLSNLKYESVRIDFKAVVS